MNPFLQFNKVLELYLHKPAIFELPKRWNEKHRYYHTVNHLVWVLQNIEINPEFRLLNIYEKHALMLASFFHDVVYDPKQTNNEDKSIEFFLKAFKNKDPKMVNTVKDIIECTKHRRRPIDKLQRIFWDADNKGFFRSYDIMLKSEKLIRQEYSHLSNKLYKQIRKDFLESCKGLFGPSTDKDLDKLLQFIEKSY